MKKQWGIHSAVQHGAKWDEIFRNLKTVSFLLFIDSTWMDPTSHGSKILNPQMYLYQTCTDFFLSLCQQMSSISSITFSNEQWDPQVAMHTVLLIKKAWKTQLPITKREGEIEKDKVSWHVILLSFIFFLELFHDVNISIIQSSFALHLPFKSCQDKHLRSPQNAPGSTG